jgi:phage terminase small subunit
MKKKRLTPKQQKFVAAVTTGGKSQKDAVVEAGYAGKNDAQLYNQANRLMRKPHVQTAIAEVIASAYPDSDSDIAQGFKRIFEGFKSGDESIKPSDFIRAVNEYAKITGQHAAKKSAQVKVNVKDYLPPGWSE